MIVKPNPDHDKRQIIAKAIRDNDGYCCCKLEHIDDYRCLCKEFRDQQTAGFCGCGLYYKVPNYPIITLCGSTRFKDDFLRVQQELTLKGYVVISVGVFGHADNIEYSEGTKEMLDDIHKQKIAMADAIYVINRDGYIGESTATEIEWAEELDKEIWYMEEKGE